ncbi:ribosomal protein S18-alanine N-acetyltransferase [Acaryochloris sp. IP29b_bin.148]|uniref:ribosomal protein S18-alanine N-acetyltransferase n=1 Tax=Acaryochloris sp. IP29b_bin.148 TaxID=2969218 RepID=UPI002633BFCB|nr:ribosomal protein S18-alanine N-acetyltransferase [Acaryochloris sp. IP29b_bin.148]
MTPLGAEHLAAAVDLDQHIFGGWWSLQGYQQEMERPSSTLLGLRLHPIHLMTGKWSSPAANRGRSAVPSLIGMGCLWRILDEAHITLLGVHPQYQGQGLGQALLCSLMQAAHTDNANRITLEVRATNAAAVALYTQFDFQIAGRRSQYYENGEDAFVLWQGSLQTPQFVRSLQDWRQKSERRLATWGCTNLKIVLN